MKLLDNCFVTVFFLFIAHFDVLSCTSKIEPFVEVGGWGKDFWKQKVQQRPKLMKVVLEWGSSEQQAISGVKLSKLLADLAFFVFELVGFVNDYVLPLVFK